VPKAKEDALGLHSEGFAVDIHKYLGDSALFHCDGQGGANEEAPQRLSEGDILQPDGGVLRTEVFNGAFGVIDIDTEAVL
jgi:hypothetical protein